MPAAATTDFIEPDRPDDSDCEDDASSCNSGDGKTANAEADDSTHATLQWSPIVLHNSSNSSGSTMQSGKSIDGESQAK
jgi:hypothetical protein